LATLNIQARQDLRLRWPEFFLEEMAYRSDLSANRLEAASWIPCQVSTQTCHRQPSRWLEAPLHSINANRDAVGERERP